MIADDIRMPMTWGYMGSGIAATEHLEENKWDGSRAALEAQKWIHHRARGAGSLRPHEAGMYSRLSLGQCAWDHHQSRCKHHKD